MALSVVLSGCTIGRRPDPGSLRASRMIRPAIKSSMELIEARAL
jgi:hypothetical protein